MSEPTPVRPPQVTIAGWLVMAGSVVVVLMAFSQVTDLRTLETREAIEEYLSKPPGESLGLSVQEAQTLLRIASMVAAACAAATAILGYQVLQRSKGARVALSALAAPLFLSGLASGGVVSAVVVAATVMLWFQPARDWFEGRTPVREAPLPAPGAAQHPPQQSPQHPPRWAPPPTAPPVQAPGQAPVQPPIQPPPAYDGAYGAPLGPPYARRPASDERPLQVAWACALTWGFATLAFVLLLLTLMLMVSQPDTLLDELHRQDPELASQGYTDASLRTSVYVIAPIGLAWSAAAVVFAVLAWLRIGWGSLALMISAGTAAALCLLLVIGSVLMLVPLAACATTLALLLRPESRRWFAGRRR